MNIAATKITKEQNLLSGKELAKANKNKFSVFQSLLNQLCKFSHKYLKFYPQILSKNEP